MKTSTGRLATDMVDLKLPFPWKLHRLLEDVEKQGKTHAVSWLPCGKAFKVHKPKEFRESVITSYFSQTKFKSFTRQVNQLVYSLVHFIDHRHLDLHHGSLPFQLYIYGFSKICMGPDAGAFFHPAFIRNNMESCLTLRRNQVEDRRRKESFKKNLVLPKSPYKTMASSEHIRTVRLPKSISTFKTTDGVSFSAKKSLSLFDETFSPDEIVSAPDEIVSEDLLDVLPITAYSDAAIAAYADDFPIFQTIPCSDLHDEVPLLTTSDLEPRPIEEMMVV
jgi:hypothetical protein